MARYQWSSQRPPECIRAEGNTTLAIRTDHPNREFGQSLVELAIILPVFLAMTVGLIDAGRAFYQYNTAAHASREAARFGAVSGGSQNPGFIWGNSSTGAYNGNWPNTYSQATGHPVSQYVGTQTIVGTVSRFVPGFNLQDLSVVVAASNGTIQNQPIRVQIDYAFRPASLILIGGRTITMTASSEMIIE